MARRQRSSPARVAAALGDQLPRAHLPWGKIFPSIHTIATVHGDRNWKIKIYPDDHAPPHFHVQTPEGESLVEIDGLKVLGKGAEPRALKAALAWAAQHAAELQQVWDEQNRRS